MLAFCALAAVLVVAAVGGVIPGANWACPAIGYVYVGDAELTFSGHPASVAACFGQG